jgi:hypothetical protein
MYSTVLEYCLFSLLSHAFIQNHTNHSAGTYSIQENWPTSDTADCEARKRPDPDPVATSVARE